MQKEDYKKLKRLSIVGVLFTVLFAVMLTNYIQEHQKKKLEAQISEDTKQLNETKKRFNEYRISKNSDEQKRYKTLLTNYQTGIANQDTTFIKACQEELETLEKKIVEKNTSYYKVQVKKLEKSNLDQAYDNELERIKEIKIDIRHCIKNKTFRKIDPLLKEWKKLLNNMSSIADNLTIHLKQIEADNYPTMKLYLSIHNINTDEVPKNLEKRYFYLSEQISSNSPDKVSIDSVKKTDNSQHIIDFVTSIKTSANKPTFKAIIKSADYLFKKSDFNSGSQIELLNSYDGIHVLQPFTGNRQQLTSKIKTLQPSSKNNLYDLLYTAIKHTANKSGAKYIIALTDGEDTHSKINYSKVIETANYYHIPIYLIGIGNQISTYTLERIATQTGGFYRNINDSSLVEEMIDTILTEQSNLYQLTYTTQSPVDNMIAPISTRKLVIAYQNRSIGGTTESKVTPSILFNTSSKTSVKAFEEINTTIKKKLNKQIKKEKLGTLSFFEFKTIKKQEKNRYKVEVLYTAQKLNSSNHCHITTQKTNFLFEKKNDTFFYKKQSDTATLVSLS